MLLPVEDPNSILLPTGEPNAMLLKRGERGDRSADLRGGERSDRLMFDLERSIVFSFYSMFTL